VLFSTFNFLTANIEVKLVGLHHLHCKVSNIVEVFQIRRNLVQTSQKQVSLKNSMASIHTHILSLSAHSSTPSRAGRGEVSVMSDSDPLHEMNFCFVLLKNVKGSYIIQLFVPTVTWRRSSRFFSPFTRRLQSACVCV